MGVTESAASRRQVVRYFPPVDFDHLGKTFCWSTTRGIIRSAFVTCTNLIKIDALLVSYGRMFKGSVSVPRLFRVRFQWSWQYCRSYHSDRSPWNTALLAFFLSELRNKHLDRRNVVIHFECSGTFIGYGTRGRPDWKYKKHFVVVLQGIVGNTVV